jgi:glycosyltransferase involved in cell wall biosynthesis
MKILNVSNNPDTSEDGPFSKTFWNNLIYPLKQKTELLDIGKKDLWKFYSKYRKFKPDIIITTWIPAAFIPVLLKKIGLIKCPIIHRWEDYYAESMKNYPYFIVNFMEKFTAKNADYIVTVLKTLQERAQKMGKTVFLLPYGSTGGNKKTKINLDSLKTTEDNVKVVYSGEINLPYKQVDKIIHAAIGEKCDLFLFGEEPKEEFKKIISENKNIHYCGYVNSQEIFEILKQGDILVNTANHDISMKFLDYIRAGKPILALNDRPSKTFKHKETAFLTEDFKEGLRELIRDKKLREKITKNMKSIKIYSWEEVAEIHLKLYSKIVAREKNLDEFKFSYFHVPFGESSL